MALYHREHRCGSTPRQPAPQTGSRRPRHVRFMLDLEFAQLSDAGPGARSQRRLISGYVAPEPPSEARQRGWLFAVADGVGGQELGEVASRTAVETMIAGFGAAAAGRSALRLLPRLVQAANIKVYETGRAAGRAALRMATTLVACALRFDRAGGGACGRFALLPDPPRPRHGADARSYRGQRQVRLGVMTAREAAEGGDAPHPQPVAGHRPVRERRYQRTSRPGRRRPAALLGRSARRGLRGGNRPAPSTSRSGSRKPPRKLIELANEHDGSDNVSVLLIRIRNVERVGMYRGRPYKLR